jgi:hypothetical protein
MTPLDAVTKEVPPPEERPPPEAVPSPYTLSPIGIIARSWQQPAREVVLVAEHIARNECDTQALLFEPHANAPKEICIIQFKHSQREHNSFSAKYIRSQKPFAVQVAEGAMCVNDEDFQEDVPVQLLIENIKPDVWIDTQYGFLKQIVREKITVDMEFNVWLKYVKYGIAFGCGCPAEKFIHLMPDGLKAKVFDFEYDITPPSLERWPSVKMRATDVFGWSVGFGHNLESIVQHNIFCFKQVCKRQCLSLMKKQTNEKLLQHLKYLGDDDNMESDSETLDDLNKKIALLRAVEAIFTCHILRAS